MRYFILITGPTLAFGVLGLIFLACMRAVEWVRFMYTCCTSLDLGDPDWTQR